MADQNSKKTHHHGDLRRALIDAAIEIIEIGGPDALTLRKCAALAGVSHAAPAHHFKGLAGLQGAVVARGYKLFAATMTRHAAAAPDDPIQQLSAITTGYLEFARLNGPLFKFMFQPHSVTPDMFDETTAQELAEYSTASYMILRNTCARLRHPSKDAVALETLVWSLVHGYAMLFTDYRVVGPDEQPIPKFTDIVPLLGLDANT